MATTSDITKGLCIEHNHDIYQIVDFQHVKPGKGPAFVRTKMKSLTSGKVLENTIPAGHTIIVTRVERRRFQYLYNEGDIFHLMDNESYEQTAIDGKLVENADLLKEGQEVEVIFNAETDTPLAADIPPFVILKVTYTEPGLKGDTATNTLKAATLETGAEIKVPLFIDIDEVIKVDTRTRSYVERVKQ